MLRIGIDRFTYLYAPIRSFVSHEMRKTRAFLFETIKTKDRLSVRPTKRAVDSRDFSIFKDETFCRYRSACRYIV